jgi:hypothetical protein
LTAFSAHWRRMNAEQDSLKALEVVRQLCEDSDMLTLDLSSDGSIAWETNPTAQGKLPIRNTEPLLGEAKERTGATQVD